MNRSKQQLRITVICSSHLRQRTKNVSQTAETAWIGHETKALCLDVLVVMAFSTVFSFSVLWEKCVVPVFKSTASSHQFNSFQSLGIIYCHLLSQWERTPDATPTDHKNSCWCVELTLDMVTQLIATQISWKHLLSLGAVTHEVLDSSWANRRRHEYRNNFTARHTSLRDF